MAKEIMKEIKGLPDYYVTNTGKIYSTKISPRYNPKGELRLVRPHIHKLGYLYANLFVGKGKSKKRVSLRIHRIVIENFIGKIPKGLTVDHLDFDKSNNNLDNLEVVTRTENILRYYRKLNKDNNLAKNYVAAYDKDGNFVGEYFSQKEAGRKLGVHAQGICNVLSGKAKTAGGYIFKIQTK